MKPYSYNLETCGICELRLDMAREEWITIHIKVTDKITVPMQICEYHAKKLLNKGHKILFDEFHSTNEY